MGVERAVTRWYVWRQILSEEITRLEAQIALPSYAVVAQGAEDDTTPNEVVDLPSLQAELTKAQKKLHLLGSCPRPMMG